MADEAPTPQAPRMFVTLFFLVWAAVSLILLVGGVYFLSVAEPDRGRGFGWLTLGTLAMLLIGWKVRWMQKKGFLGAAPGV